MTGEESGKWGLTNDKQLKRPAPRGRGGSGPAGKKGEADSRLQIRKIKRAALAFAALVRLWEPCWSRGKAERARKGVGIGEERAEELRQSPQHARDLRPTLPRPGPPSPVYSPGPPESYRGRPAPLASPLFRPLLSLCPPRPAFLSAPTTSRHFPKSPPSPNTPSSAPLPASWRRPGFNPDEEDRVRARRFRCGSPGGVGGSEPEGEGECRTPRFRPCCSRLAVAAARIRRGIRGRPSLRHGL